MEELKKQICELILSIDNPKILENLFKLIKEYLIFYK